jgi:hypothetical protein
VLLQLAVALLLFLPSLRERLRRPNRADGQAAGLPQKSGAQPA